LTTAVVIPVYQPRLSPDEGLAVSSLRKTSGVASIVAIAPESLGDVPIETDRVEHFDDRFFASVDSYSRLLLSREFLDRFVNFRFVLIGQLDCHVFGDDLADWETSGFDYIGAPWFRSAADPDEGFLAVGNGGFSLRSIEAATNVLDSETVPSYGRSVTAERWMPDLVLLPQPKRIAKALRVIREARRGVAWYTSNYTLNEDKFWGLRARLFDPSFRIAPVEKALEFSFECYPRYCYELNGRRLPFGCHAWAKHDREFWKQFIDVPIGS
jgi:hypothetical protein